MYAAVQATREAVSTLQRLIETNIDSAGGFREAADKVRNQGLAQLFRTTASERDAQAAKLKMFVAASGAKPVANGTACGTLHRWWLSLRGTISDGAEHGMLAEAERGEDSIKERYEEALEDLEDPAVRAVVERQYHSVKLSHERVRRMRDQWKSS
jgi:uncharacterized protein (TIGR02284 family)